MVRIQVAVSARDRAVEVVRPVVGDVEDRVLVDVVVPGVPGAHVEDVLQPAALPDGAGELRQVRGDEIVRRHQPLRVQPSAEDRRQRLRDRHQQVRVGRPHAVEVALGDDGPVLQHQEAVRERLGEHLVERAADALERERERAEVALGARQLPHRPVATADHRGAHEVGDVAEAIAVVGRVEPVLGGDAQGAAGLVDHHRSVGHPMGGLVGRREPSAGDRGCGST